MIKSMEQMSEYSKHYSIKITVQTSHFHSDHFQFGSHMGGNLAKDSLADMVGKMVLCC